MKYHWNGTLNMFRELDKVATAPGIIKPMPYEERKKLNQAKVVSTKTGGGDTKRSRLEYKEYKAQNPRPAQEEPPKQARKGKGKGSSYWDRSGSSASSSSKPSGKAPF